MRKTFRYLLRGGLLLGAALLAGAYLSLNALVKKGIEAGGPLLTKTDVRLDRANLLPLAGTGTLHGLVIGNPKGCKAENALSARSVRVKVRTKTLLSSVIVVESLEVVDPEISFEGSLSDNNLTRLQKNIEAFGSEREAGGPAAPAKKVMIDDFQMTGAKVHLDLKPFPSATIDLPDIRLTGIGRKTGGATMQDAAKQVLGAVTGAITASVSDSLKEIGKDVGSAGKALAKTLGGLFKTD